MYSLHTYTYICIQFIINLRVYMHMQVHACITTLNKYTVYEYPEIPILEIKIFDADGR